MSDDGSDDNDCRSESTPCRNLQTVLNRATDGADIYVTSDTLSMNGRLVYDRLQRPWTICTIESPLSYTISHLKAKFFTPICNADYDLSHNTLGLYFIV